jgi:nucleoside-diphosphate-sugar epimerase
MHILLTGGAGFIGSHVVDALVADPRVDFVRVLDNFSTGSRENLAHL